MDGRRKQLPLGSMLLADQHPQRAFSVHAGKGLVEEGLIVLRRLGKNLQGGFRRRHDRVLLAKEADGRQGPVTLPKLRGERLRLGEITPNPVGIEDLACGERGWRHRSYPAGPFRRTRSVVHKLRLNRSSIKQPAAKSDPRPSSGKSTRRLSPDR